MGASWISEENPAHFYEEKNPWIKPKQTEVLCETKQRGKQSRVQRDAESKQWGQWSDGGWLQTMKFIITGFKLLRYFCKWIWITSPSLRHHWGPVMKAGGFYRFERNCWVDIDTWKCRGVGNELSFPGEILLVLKPVLVSPKATKPSSWGRVELCRCYWPGNCAKSHRTPG